jgi:hypothetical protein
LHDDAFFGGSSRSGSSSLSDFFRSGFSAAPSAPAASLSAWSSPDSLLLDPPSSGSSAASSWFRGPDCSTDPRWDFVVFSFFFELFFFLSLFLLFLLSLSESLSDDFPSLSAWPESSVPGAVPESASVLSSPVEPLVPFGGLL